MWVNVCNEGYLIKYNRNWGNKYVVFYEIMKLVCLMKIWYFCKVVSML